MTDEVRAQKRANVIRELEESGARFDIDAVATAIEQAGAANFDLAEIRRADAREAIRDYRRRVTKSEDFESDFLNLWEWVTDPKTGKEKKQHYYKGGHATTLDEDRQYKTTLEKESRASVAKLQKFLDHCIQKHGQSHQRFFKFDPLRILRDPVREQ